MVATMVAPSSTAVTTRFDGNGTPLSASVPATAPPSASPTPVEVPRKRGVSGATLAGIATAVGVAAIALGAWAVVLSVSSNDSSEASAAAVELQGVRQVVSLLSKPSTERIPLEGSAGRIILVVGARGYGVLVLDGLAPAPGGKSYQAWLIRPNAKTPKPAAVFSGADVVVPLTTTVPPGGAVAITIERAGGVSAPTRTPKLVATRTT